MAESMAAHMAETGGFAVEVSSAATHSDELGSPPHRGTIAKLKEKGIPVVPHRARLMTREDGRRYDLLIGMDEANLRDMRRILGGQGAEKVRLLLDFTDRRGSIADPWYTGDFEETYRDVLEGLEGLFSRIAAGNLTF